MSFCIVHVPPDTNYKMRIYTTATRFLAFFGLVEFGLASPRTFKNVKYRSPEASIIKPKVFIIDMVYTP